VRVPSRLFYICIAISPPVTGSRQDITEKMDIPWTDGDASRVITEFDSERRLLFSRYSDSALEYTLPLIKGDVVYFTKKAGTDSLCSFSHLQQTSMVELAAEEGDPRRTLFHTAGIDALMPGYDHNSFNMFPNAISHWYADSWLSVKAVKCRSINIMHILFVQFMLTWFSALVCGGYPAYVLGLKPAFNDIDLFIPVTVSCALYGDSLIGLNVDALTECIRTHFLRGIKKWLIRYSDYDAYDEMNAEQLFTCLDFGFRKYLPRRIRSILMYAILKLYTKCSSEYIRERMTHGYVGIRNGFLRITDIFFSIDIIIIRFVPYDDRCIYDLQSWNAFFLLSNFYAHFTRCMISEFEIIKRVDSDVYHVSVRRMHTLFYPCLQLDTMHCVLNRYLLGLSKYVNMDSKARRSVWHIRKKLTKYNTRKTFGFPIDNLRTINVPTLSSICLATVICYRDLSPEYFVKNFRSLGLLVHGGIHKAIMTVANGDIDLTKLQDSSIELCFCVQP
jgi:hypothetical protein